MCLYIPCTWQVIENATGSNYRASLLAYMLPTNPCGNVAVEKALSTPSKNDFASKLSRVDVLMEGLDTIKVRDGLDDVT